MTARHVGASTATLWLTACLALAVALAVGHGDAMRGLAPADFGAAVAFTTVGSFLLVRGAVRNVAVVLTLQGVFASLTVVASEIVDLTVHDGPLHGASLWFAWASNLVWLPGVVLLVPLVLLFPDGRLLSRRWRWPIRYAVGCALVFAVVAIVFERSLEDDVPESLAPNPTGFIRVSGTGARVLDVIASATVPALGVGLLLGVAGVAVRRRRAVGVERAQLTCLFLGAALTATMFVSSFALPATSWWDWAVAFLAVFPISVAISVAVLRYRLYEIDRVVSRTVTYVLVLTVLLGVYVGVLSGLAALIPAEYGQIGVAAATLAVAALAVPLTRRVRGFVDRRFHRGRFDAERVVTAFAARLRAQPDRGDVAGDLVAVLQRTVQPSHAAVWTVTR